MIYPCTERFTGTKFLDAHISDPCNGCDHALLAHKMTKNKGELTAGRCEVCHAMTELTSQIELT